MYYQARAFLSVNYHHICNMASPWHFATVLISVPLILSFDLEQCRSCCPRSALTFLHQKFWPNPDGDIVVVSFAGKSYVRPLQSKSLQPVPLNPPSASTCLLSNHPFQSAEKQLTTPRYVENNNMMFFGGDLNSEANLAFFILPVPLNLYLYFCICIFDVFHLFLYLVALLAPPPWCWQRLTLLPVPASLGVDLGPARLTLGDFCCFPNLSFLFLPFSVLEWILVGGETTKAKI